MTLTLFKAFIELGFDYEQAYTCVEVTEQASISKENKKIIFDKNWHALQMQALALCASIGLELKYWISREPNNFDRYPNLWDYNTELHTMIKEALHHKANAFNVANGYPVIPYPTINNEVVKAFVERMKDDFQALHQTM